MRTVSAAVEEGGPVDFATAARVVTATPDTRTQDTWDRFLARTPDGSFRQSTAWARVKARQGWHASRVVLRHGDEILGGAQVLSKPLPGGPITGRIAYCSHAPLLREPDPVLATRILAQLRVWCRRQRVRALVVQPPRGDQAVGPLLDDLGCVPSPVPVAPRATVRLDLAPDLTTIEQRLGKSLRKHLRRAARAGVTVRRGGRDDLATFHRLLVAAAARLDYAVFGRSYYEALWDEFGHDVAIFLAEVHGVPVSAQLALVHGDTLHALAQGWDGSHGEAYPNDVIDWHVVAHAKTRGLRWYDLENLSLDVAERLVAGVGTDRLTMNGSDRYKLKWGNDVVVFPQPRLYLPDPVVRRLGGRIPPSAVLAQAQRLGARVRDLRGSA
ncbi:lipid II:glycine glycyltransferase FemX [Egicoccus sp. AB-alg2]|uniref:lipid II:glycine glycyltransferase FemX n=1 Tax=Egicoccus sp. AB-alg2 TaxID=3242693 RepID=UPI00359DF08E